jgi:CheY-like chemotaxis protein
MKLDHDPLAAGRANQADAQPGLPEPLKEKLEESSDSRQNPRPAAPILVVEDNPINQKVLATLLRKRGYEVDVANDGAQAIQLVAEKSYGLIFMDLQMPVLDGLEAARLIRSIAGGPQPPIIAVTAYTLNGEAQRCLEAGMNGYLPKPVDTQKLFDTVQRCLRTA